MVYQCSSAGICSTTFPINAQEARSIMPEISSPEITERSVGEQAHQALHFTKHYVTSYYRSRKEHAQWQDVHTYCMFVGHARSGGSIMGALLDAHPDVVLADEVDALRYLSVGFNQQQIYSMILARSRKQATKGRTKGGRDGKVYSYLVPGQWQGRFRRLRVIGDSKAGFSTQRLAQDGTLLPRLQRTMQHTNIKIIHVLRNPYDTVSTMYLRSGRSLEDGIERYFSNCETIAALRQEVADDGLLSVKHETFVRHPQAVLRRMCEFLGVEAPQDYLDACAGILYQSPAKSRHKVPWSADLIDAVQHQIGRFDFLHGYGYEDEEPR